MRQPLSQTTINRIQAIFRNACASVGFEISDQMRGILGEAFTESRQLRMTFLHTCSIPEGVAPTCWENLFVPEATPSLVDYDDLEGTFYCVPASSGIHFHAITPREGDCTVVPWFFSEDIEKSRFLLRPVCLPDCEYEQRGSELTRAQMGELLVAFKKRINGARIEGVLKEDRFDIKAGATIEDYTGPSNVMTEENLKEMERRFSQRKK